MNLEDNKPVAHATIYHNGRVTYSDEEGKFNLTRVDEEKPVLIKAAGFRQRQVPFKKDVACDVRLKPFAAKGLYLSIGGIGARFLRDPALALIDGNELNTLVVDLKSDRGLLTIECDIPMARKTGAITNPPLNSPKEFIQQMHQRNIYVIGKMVVFKDNPLAQFKPEWTIVDEKTEKPFAERDGLVWMDPYQKGVWDYNISIAKAAAEVGFDEIQFDYVRFPATEKKLIFSKDDSNEARSEAIEGFLERAYKELLPYNIYVSADVFGDILWHHARIGQTLETINEHVDYLCPMIYPSAFGRNSFSQSPVTIPGKVISLSIERGAAGTGGKTKIFRPWLQNFKDYAFDKREFKEEEIALQIDACNKGNTGGWFLWDASNKYRYTPGAIQFITNGTVSKLAGWVRPTVISTNAAVEPAVINSFRKIEPLKL